jgi:hypothetical protein
LLNDFPFLLYIVFLSSSFFAYSNPSSVPPHFFSSSIPSSVPLHFLSSSIPSFFPLHFLAYSIPSSVPSSSFPFLLYSVFRSPHLLSSSVPSSAPLHFLSSFIPSFLTSSLLPVPVLSMVLFRLFFHLSILTIHPNFVFLSSSLSSYFLPLSFPHIFLLPPPLLSLPHLLF